MVENFPAIDGSWVPGLVGWSCGLSSVFERSRASGVCVSSVVQEVLRDGYDVAGVPDAGEAAA